MIVGTLHYGKVLCATATIGYKHHPADRASVLAMLQQPNFLLKVIPHVDGSPRICELVRYHLEEISIKEAWHAPADLQLFRHVAADVARLPVLEVISGSHFVADLVLGYGEVVFDYLDEQASSIATLNSRRANTSPNARVLGKRLSHTLSSKAQ